MSLKRRFKHSRASTGYDQTGIRKSGVLTGAHGTVRVLYSRPGSVVPDPPNKKGLLAKKYRQDPPETEKILRDALKAFEKEGVYFQHQAVLHGYIGDFYCLQKMLLIELDGPHHFRRRAYDRKRDFILAKYGIRTVRYPVTRLSDMDSLLRDIAAELDAESSKSQQSKRQTVGKGSLVSVPISARPGGGVG